MTNRYNVASRAQVATMNIYDEPHYMEEPVPIIFIDAAAVTDLPDAPLLVDHGAHDPTLMNFSVDWSAAFRTVDDLLRATAA